MKEYSDHQAEDCNDDAVRKSKSTKNSEKMCKDTEECKNAGKYHTS